MTGLGPPLPSPVDPHVGVIVYNTRAVPHPTPACPQATAARPYGLHRPIISLLLTQTTRQSPSHITPVLPCPPVSLWLPPSHRFEDHLGVRRPSARWTCTFVFFMQCWQGPFCSPHNFCIPEKSAIKNAASRRCCDGRV